MTAPPGTQLSYLLANHSGYYRHVAMTSTQQRGLSMREEIIIYPASV